MKKTTLASLLALPLLLPSLAAAAVPATMAFSARVADNGQPVNGTATFKFTLWKVATGGTAGTDDVYNETQTGVNVANGVVSVTLGDTTANPAPNGQALPAFDGTPLWLEVSMTIGSSTSTFTPRMPIQSVPYALAAPVSCTKMTNTITIGATSSNGSQVFCPAAFPTVVGGGWFSFGTTVFILDNGPYNFGTGDYWYVGAYNPNATATNFYVYARCCR